MIEEGIATYLQSNLIAPPMFMYRMPGIGECRTTARRYARTLDRLNVMHKDPRHAMSTTDERLYRFGYALVQEYINRRRTPITYPQLAQVPKSLFKRLLKQWVRELRKA